MPSGTAKDLYLRLLEARENGQERSPLAEAFSVDGVVVSAHHESAPNPYSTHSTPTVAAIHQRREPQRTVEVRYSRLVDPLPPDELVGFVDNLRALAGHPGFVRLNRTKQLGTTYLSGNIGASHSRLEHSLGVLDITLIFCEKLSIFFSEHPQWEPERFTILRSIAILAFIHDAFHGPYGHTMDPIRHIIDPACNSDRLDKAALNHEIERAKKKSGWLWEALSNLYQDGSEAQERDIKTLDMIVGGHPKYAFALEIIDSAIDADRLDYIPRDQAHLFLGETLAIQDIAERSRFFPDDDGNPRLHFAGGSENKLMRLLEQRAFLYDTVYEAISKVPYDEMILHAVLLLFEEFQSADLAYRKGSADYEWRLRISEEFSRLSDEDLERLFERIQTTPKIALARLLLQDVRANAPFKVVLLESIPSNSISVMRARVNTLTDQMTAAFRNLPAAVQEAYHAGADAHPIRFHTARYTAVDELFKVASQPAPYTTKDSTEFEILKSSGKVESAEKFPEGGGRLILKPLPNERLYWMCLTLADNILARRQFEWRLWEMFRHQWKGYDTWRTNLANKVVDVCMRAPEGTLPEKERPQLFQEAMKLVNETSLIFVSATRIPPTLKDIVLRHKSKEGPIRLYDEKRHTREASQPYEKHGPPSYHIVVCAPSSLGEGAFNSIHLIWEEAGDKWLWYEPA